jgi:c-di-GMP-binding flagellar brake protein YcgR
MRLIRRRAAREMFEHLRPGVRLQVLHEPEKEYFMTVIKHVEKEGFTILEPVSGDRILEMPLSSSWQFCLPGEDAVYFFTSRIVEIVKEDSNLYYLLKPPDSVHRQQRRGHVRVPCHHNLTYWFWRDPSAAGLPSPDMAAHSSNFGEDSIWIQDYLGKLEEKIPGKNAFTLDISGGGLRMVTLESLERHDRLLIRIHLDEQRSRQVMILEAKVVRVVPLNIGGWRRYRVGVTFVNLNEKVRERIISYLFKIMRNKI